MAEVKIVIPDDFGDTLALGIKEPGKWDVVSSGGVDFATDDEIDTGGPTTADKAVSAEKFQTRVRVTDNNSSIGIKAGELLRGRNNTYIGYLTGASASCNFSTAIGRQAGQGNIGNNQTALGTNAGYGNTKNFQTVFGDNSGYGNAGGFQVAIGANSGFRNEGDYQVAIGYDAGRGNKATSSTFIGANFQNLDNTAGATNINLFGADARVREGESNYFQIGNPNTENVYCAGTFHGINFNWLSDKRTKIVGDLLRRLDCGIEVYRFQYIHNGAEAVGWIAQQVEDVMREKGFSESIIELAIPRKRDIDWEATIEKYNQATGQSITLWREATEHPQVLQEYLVYADDIRSINKNIVRDLLF